MGDIVSPQDVEKAIKNMIFTSKYGTLHVIVAKEFDVIAGFIHEVKAVPGELYLSSIFIYPPHQQVNVFSTIFKYLHDYATENRLARGKAFVINLNINAYTLALLQNGWTFNGYDTYIL